MARGRHLWLMVLWVGACGGQGRGTALVDVGPAEHAAADFGEDPTVPDATPDAALPDAPMGEIRELGAPEDVMEPAEVAAVETEALELPWTDSADADVGGPEHADVEVGPADGVSDAGAADEGAEVAEVGEAWPFDGSAGDFSAPDPGTPDPGAPDPGMPDPGVPDPGALDPGAADLDAAPDTPTGGSGWCSAKTLEPWSRSLSSAGGTVTFNEVRLSPPEAPELEWIELHNPMAVALDLSGWRLDGAIRFDFAEGTLAPAGGYLVVAADPAQLASASGFSAALGPYVGRLPEGGADLELRSNTDRLMDALSYADTEPWPASPFGSGASLAKRDPQTASAPAESWAGSLSVGGTPGQPNLAGPPPAGLRFNEVAGGGPSFWVELVNAGPAPAELEGATVALSSGFELVLPEQSLEPGALRLLDDVELGFAVAAGQRLFLFSADHLAVHDAVAVQGVPRARAVPGDGPWLYPDTATPGAPNQVVVNDQVVINELMYHHGPLAGVDGEPLASAEEWIELTNRGSDAVDVGGWQLVDDIEYKLPAGLTIPPGGYLVVARNASALKAAHPTVPIVGNFKGKLDNAGAKVVLRDACGNPVDEVRYFDGGRWPGLADGGGSSLELRSPFADNAAPEAWGASNEAGGAAWHAVSYQGVAAPSSLGPDGRWHELVLGLLDDGVVLVDDVSVLEDPEGAAIERLQDGTFESGAAVGWRLLGNHRHSRVIADPSSPGNHVLRLEATGAAEHMHNHAETTLAEGATLVNGQTYRVSFRARWAAGSNQLNSRLYFNRLARTTLVPRPAVNGTPGAPNSCRVANLGPTYRDLAHGPVVPQPLHSVTVSVRVDDPDGVAGLTLVTSVEGGPPTHLPMLDVGGGRYEAVVPGQPASAVVQFYVVGVDALGATSTFPAAGADSRALWKVDDGLAATNGLHNLRLVMTPADADWLHAEPNVMSNDALGATVVVDEREVFYDVGVRLKGSERGRSMPLRAGFVLSFSDDRPFRGVYESVMVDRSEGVHFGQREMLVNQAMSHAGSLSAEYDDLVHVMPPRLEHTGPAELQMARFGDLLLDHQFENGSDGSSYEYELVYYPTTTVDGTPEGLKLPQPDLVVGTPIRDLGPDEEAWRYAFILRNNLDRDDFSRLMAFARVYALAGAEADPQIEAVIDVGQWLRAFAFATVSGAVDNYASGAAHNAVLYVRPEDQRVLYFPHDLDFVVGPTNVPVVASPDLARLLANPARLRQYYGHVRDLAETSFSAAYLGPWCAHYGALLPAQDFAGHLQFIVDRALWVMNGAPDAVTKVFPPVVFEITTNGGADLAVADATLLLEGQGWIDVREVWRLGEFQPLPLAWVGPTAWQVEVPLACGENELVLETRGPRGEVVGGDAITVTSEAAGCP